MSHTHWSYKLIRDLKDERLHLASTHLSVAIKDLYPKARHHFLVLPKKAVIDTLYDLKIGDVKLLDDMFQLGRRVVYEQLGKMECEFKFGFHMAPHMKRLHLHVISMDFDSPGMKRRHHWTIFNTSLFMTYADVKNELKQCGMIKPRSQAYIEALRNGPLTCNFCSFSADELNDMKKHIVTHWK